MLCAVLIWIIGAGMIWGGEELAVYAKKGREIAVYSFFSYMMNHGYPALAPAPAIETQGAAVSPEEDPAYKKAVEHPYLLLYGNEETNQEPAEMEMLMAAENQAASGNDQDPQNDQQTPEAKEAASRFAFPGKTYQLAQLEDYDFLIGKFYNIHTSTTASRELMSARNLLGKSFVLGQNEEQQQAEQPEPQILIYHTHSQEAFIDSQEGQTVVAVGDYLTEILQAKGFSVYHDRTVYDLRDGKLDRNQAYSYAYEGINQILADNPSIQVVIDLHRDGVKEGVHLVTEIDGKQTAKLMFFNGLSETPDGPIASLENPYREDNLAFSLQMQLKAEAHYPGLMRKIYLKGLRYNQHLRPSSCLLEVGAQTNTFQEALNAMEPFGEVLAMVLQGK